MVVIKHYPNRKLYNTTSKQYITLDGIAGLVRQGLEIQVLDNATGDDLTNLTLAQIILEQEKSQHGLLPMSFLTDLIRTSGDRISALKSSLRAPGLFYRQVDEEIRLRLKTLVSSGELSEQEANTLTEKLLSPSTKMGCASKPAQAFGALLIKHQLSTREDLRKLNDQIDELSDKLAELTSENP